MFIVYAYPILTTPPLHLAPHPDGAPLMESPRQLVVDAHTQTVCVLRERFNAKRHPARRTAATGTRVYLRTSRGHARGVAERNLPSNNLLTYEIMCSPPLLLLWSMASCVRPYIVSHTQYHARVFLLLDLSAEGAKSDRAAERYHVVTLPGIPTGTGPRRL